MDHEVAAGRATVVHVSELGECELTRAALRLHVYATIASIEAGRAGLVTDAYLDAVAAPTTVPALELWMAGLWSRVAGGYRVLASETLRMAGVVHRQLEQLAQGCRDSGGHVAAAGLPGECVRCGIALH